MDEDESVVCGGVVCDWGDSCVTNRLIDVPDVTLRIALSTFSGSHAKLSESDGGLRSLY